MTWGFVPWRSCALPENRFRLLGHRVFARAQVEEGTLVDSKLPRFPFMYRRGFWPWAKSQRAPLLRKYTGLTFLFIRRLLAGSSVGRSSCFAGVFERSELARLPSGGHPLDSGQTGRQWFWVLLPKQKNLGCRAETRQISFNERCEGLGHLYQRFFNNRWAFTLSPAFVPLRTKPLEGRGNKDKYLN